MDISPALLNGVGVAGLLVGLFWMLASGRIVTRREHDGRVADKDAQIELQQKTIDIKDHQLEKLDVVGTTTIHILESIRALARERGDGP